jgi:hypothetical protein
MWGLYLFGKFLVLHLTVRNFYILYFVGLLVGNLIFMAFNWNTNQSLIGASGALSAVMMAAAMWEPNQQFRLLFLPFTPIKMSTMVIGYTILEFLLQSGKFNTGISHLCHLGGSLGGYIVMKVLYGNNVVWDPLKVIFGKNNGKSFYEKKDEKDSFFSNFNSNKAQQPQDDNTPVSSKELDALLDKISHEGINSLSEYELARLRKARNQMRGE